MKKVVTVFSVCFLVAATFLFNNCSKVGFSPIATDELNSLTAGPPPPEVIQEVVTNCENAAASGKLHQVVTEVKFADSRTETGLSNICSAMNDGSNYEIFTANGYNGKVAARYEQRKALSLPANAVVCGVELSNNLASFMYDDAFYLTFNNYVIATNNKFSIDQRLDHDEIKVPSQSNFTKLFKYDWLKLRGAGFASTIDDYCVGSDQNLGSCSWPITEQAGSIKLAWSPELLIAIGLSSKTQEFMFAVTGDNNPTIDCYHQELNFQTTVKYYLAQ